MDLVEHQMCIYMEPRELSESMNNLDKDVNLNSDPVAEVQHEDAIVKENKEIVSPDANDGVEQSTVADEPEVSTNESAIEDSVVKDEQKAETNEAQEELGDEKNEEVETSVDSIVENPSPVEDAQTKDLNLSNLSKDEIVARLEELLAQPIETIKDIVLGLKAAFFAIRKDEIAKEKAAFLEAGNDEAAFEPAEDSIEMRVKDILNDIKDKRAEFNAAQQAEKLQNLEKKRDIIKQIAEITSDPDNINRQYNKVQQLQQEFKSIGAVPPTDDTDVWKSYQQTVEKFYDLLKINKELRDYDFKKNLEIKQQLCADAEALDDENDIVVAFKKLQDLHNNWRETGPVAKELREDLWARFKNASAVINKKYQAFFEERKAHEKEAADAKISLCEQIEAILAGEFKNHAAWDDATKKIIELQQKWKEAGFAARKLNNDLFARFRKSCDEFFANKVAYYKNVKETMSANLAKKIELCEKAESLKDSTDWKSTSDAMVALQKEWKTVGPVNKRQSDAVWKRFITACDYFFEQRKQKNVNIHAVEHENLKAKKAVIAQIKAIVEGDENDESANAIRELMAKWQEIGHVPFREKDKIYKEYREAVDAAYDKFDMKGSKAHLANYESNLNNLGDNDKVYHERERLVRSYEQKCNELKTYENNMGFFNAQSKTGNSIVKELERKIARLKEDIAMLEQKIKIVDDKI